MLRTFLLIAIGTLPNLTAAGVSGRWVGTMGPQGSPVRIFLTVVENNHQISGIISTGDETRQIPIENPEIHDGRLSFEVHDNTNRVVAFHLNREDSRLVGSAGVGGQVSEVSLSRPVFKIGGGVTAPILIHRVQPQYTKEARKARMQGTVLVYAEIDPDGVPTNIKVVRALGMGLDEKAVEAVKQWKFRPGQKDGEAVSVAATFEMNFRL